jgi:hypothetical protein
MEWNNNGQWISVPNYDGIQQQQQDHPQAHGLADEHFLNYGAVGFAPNAQAGYPHHAQYPYPPGAAYPLALPPYQPGLVNPAAYQMYPAQPQYASGPHYPIQPEQWNVAQGQFAHGFPPGYGGVAGAAPGVAPPNNGPTMYPCTNHCNRSFISEEARDAHVARHAAPGGRGERYDATTSGRRDTFTQRPEYGSVDKCFSTSFTNIPVPSVVCMWTDHRGLCGMDCESSQLSAHFAAHKDNYPLRVGQDGKVSCPWVEVFPHGERRGCDSRCQLEGLTRHIKEKHARQFMVQCNTCAKLMTRKPTGAAGHSRPREGGGA